MPDDLYERDIYAWAQRQGGLLRRMQAGERVNELDWDHVIEEVEDVGRSEMRACGSLLARALEHLLKLRGWSESQNAPHWRAETRVFLRDARAAFSPSMAQYIDLADIYEDARDAVLEERVDGTPPASLPATCPFALSELLVRPRDLDALIERFAAGAAP